MDIDVRRVLDSLGEPMLALDRSLRILHANGGLKELLGWSHRELLGRPLSEVVPGEVPEAGHPPVRVSAVRRNGSRREVEVRLSPWTGGEAEGLLLASFRGLDALVELEKQLRLCQRLSVLEAALAMELEGAVDEREAAYALLRACGEAEGWVFGAYWRVDRKAGVLRPHTLWTSRAGLTGYLDTTWGHTFARDEGLVGRAWARREPQWSRDVGRDERFWRAEVAARQGLRGGLFAPLVGRGRVYGVLELLCHEPREDREADEAVASMLGHQLGRFLDRLRREELERTRRSALGRLWDSELLGLFVSDAQGRLLDANPALLRMLGYTRRDVREERLSWPALVSPDYRAMSEGALRRLRQEGVSTSFEGELLRHNGSGVPALVGSARLGRGRVVSFALDLSDWKPVERDARQEVEARLHALLAHVPVVLFALDRDGVFTLSEGQGLEPLGLKPGQVVGLSVFDVYRAEPGVLAHARRALEGEEFHSVEALSNGQLFETHWTPLRDAEGHPSGTIGLALDVTRREREARWRARLFQEAEEARAAAEEAVRVRDEFLTLASHELKTPLTSLNLQLQALLKRARGRTGLDTAEVRERLEKARGQLHKLVRLTEELLEVSQVAAGRVELERREVDLVEVVREVLERFQGEARRTGTPLELKGEEAVVGRWDRERLEQVVTNLVSNAVKYGAGAPVEVSVRSSGAMALLEVRDQGIGIAAEDLERIFGKFERAVPVRRYGGFGLGLYIVRQLVEALGGAVDVESAPGEGATFRLVLPLAGPETRPRPAPPEAGLH